MTLGSRHRKCWNWNDKVLTAPASSLSPTNNVIIPREQMHTSEWNKWQKRFFQTALSLNKWKHWIFFVLKSSNIPLSNEDRRLWRCALRCVTLPHYVISHNICAFHFDEYTSPPLFPTFSDGKYRRKDLSIWYRYFGKSIDSINTQISFQTSSSQTSHP